MLDSLISKNPFLAMLLANIVLGTSSVMIVLGLETIALFTFMGLRYTMVGAIQLTQYYNGKKVHLTGADARQLIFHWGLQLSFALSWFVALTKTQAINASIIFLLTPIAVYAGSVLFLKEPRSNRALSGALIALVGGLLLFGAPSASGDADQLLGNGLLLISMLAFAALVVHSKRLTKTMPTELILGSRFLIAGIFGLGAALIFEDVSAITEASLVSWAALLVSVIFAGSLATQVFTKALSKMRAEDSAPLYYVDPLAGTIASALILGDTLSSFALIAAAVIVLGVVIAHPIHLHRMTFYYLPYKSRLETFVDWVKNAYSDATKLAHKFF